MIKLSLRKKVCVFISAFTMICALLLLLAIGFGFKPFFYQYKKESIISMSHHIANMYKETGIRDIDTFDQISQQAGSAVFIVDKGQLVYSSRPNRKAVVGKPHFDESNMVTAKAPRRMTTDAENENNPIPRHIGILRKLFNGQTLDKAETDQVFVDGNEDNIRFMSYVCPANDEETAYVVVSQPVAPVEATIAVVQQFVVICGLIWLFLAICGSIFFTNRLTRPLLRLKQLSVAMAHLDFSKRWADTRTDEIGELGTSLNVLSSQLDTALTELKRTNEELEVQLKKANELEEMRKAFISAVSHELKTPLALIQGYAEGLDSLSIDEKTRQHYCKVINNETEKMDKLVKDLLNLSRLETGSFQIEMTEFDFHALAEEMQYRFAGIFRDKQLQVEWNLPEDMEVYGDPERVDTILSNFLSNAIDYTDAGKKIRISAQRKADCYQICIYNQGIGIAKEDQPRIWEPFYKVDVARTRRSRTFGGHGLGLGIVSALVKLHGQTYGVRNESDGVTFWFTLAAR